MGRLAAAAFVGLLLLPRAANADDGEFLVQIADGIFVHQGVHEDATQENLGGYANVGVIVGGDSVAVVDSGGSAAHGAEFRAAIRGISDLPVRHVILTHGHPDHVFGSAAFAADRPDFVGHAKLAQAMASRGPHYLQFLRNAIGEAADGTELIPPTVEVAESHEIDLGGRVLRLAAHPTAHTDADLTVFDEATGTLFAGDLLFMERVPVVDGSLKGWFDVLDSLRRIDAVRVVPGHGPVSAPWPAAMAPQERYLNVLLDEIRAVIKDGGTMEQAVVTVGQAERPNWLLFDDNHPRNVIAGFAELEWE